MILDISKLKREELKPFQNITILYFEDVNIYDSENISIDLSMNFQSNIPLDNQVDELLSTYFDGYESKIFDISYMGNNKQIFLNWSFVKQRAKQMKMKTSYEILSDSLMNICLSSNLLVKDTFDYYGNLMNTLSYYAKSLSYKQLILRIDNYNGNKFFVYNQ